MRYLYSLRLSALLLTVGLIFSTTTLKAQTDEGNFLIDVSSDLYRLDNQNPFKPFNRFAVALDLHYFPVKSLTFGAGGEVEAYAGGGTNTFWTTHLRYYIVGNAFLRVRGRFNGLFRSGSDVMLGAGYDFMLDENWAVEVQGDYYLLQVQNFGFRAGINWFL